MSNRILLVEDDHWLGECYSAWLHEFGHEVIWVRSAQAALDALDENEVKLILLDIMLPFANGVHFMNVLASHSDLSKIPVVVCSSMAPEGLERLYGVKAVLDKAEVTPIRMQTALAGALASEISTLAFEPETGATARSARKRANTYIEPTSQPVNQFMAKSQYQRQALPDLETGGA